ncbi:MAG: hypothetical protein ABRQ25_06495 [Clostridiaceae bacterium]
MSKTDKKSLLKDTEDYENITENVAKLSKEEMEMLGISHSCGCCSGGCCKNKSKKS